MLGWEFPPWKTGGLGTACHGLTKGLARQGVDVTFVLPHADDTPDVSIAASAGWSLRLKGVRSRLSPYAGLARAGRRGAQPPHDVYAGDLHAEVERFASAAARIAREEPHDVIHAHDWMTWPAAIAARRVSGRPFVAHLHATESDRTAGHPNAHVAAIEREGLRAADVVIANSRYTKDNAVRLYGVDPEKVRVVHFGVDWGGLEELPREARALPEERVVHFLGRLTVQKGPDYFLDAAANVLRFLDDVRFVVVGDGDMLPWMMERAAELGIADHVTFAGFLHGADVHRAFRMADLYVMPSVSEPYGMAALEALQNDVPVLVSRQSGVSEVLRHALKVDAWDVQDMTSKIVSVLTYPELGGMLREGAREEVRRLDLDTAARETIAVYRELVAA